MTPLVFVFVVLTATPGPEQVVADFNAALVARSVDAFRATVGESLFMSGGAGSTDPAEWEAHMYLTGERLDSWARFFVLEAGPHRNDFAVRRVHARGDAALVVTRDTGSNAFRSWKDEEVVWTLRRGEDGWRILGFFLSDAKNPDSGG